MGPTEKLIQQFAREGHPLGQGIEIEELPDLIEALRQRLIVSNEELDLSPSSLNRLEQHLIDLFRSMNEAKQKFADEELVQLVREIAAYIGEVLVTQADGRWGDQTKTLWATEVIIEGPWEVIKDRRNISPYAAHFVVGSEAAWVWDAITVGKKPYLYRTYRDAHTRRLRERL